VKQPGSKKHPQQPSLHPLDVLLQQQTEDSKSMLGLIAQRNLEAWQENDAGRARDTIIQKIEKFKYSHPDSKGKGKSFSSILRKAGSLEVFLDDSLQTEIAKWVLLRNILHDDRKNKQIRRSDDGLPIQFVRTLLTELARHLEVIEEAVAKYECRGAISTYYGLVTKEFRQNAKALISYRQPRLWRELLGESELGVKPKDEQVSIRARIFRALQAKLQNQRSKTAGISDQFLWQLTELMLGVGEESRLRTGRTRYAVKSRSSPGKISKKS
jgi:hypothetical protein